MIRNAKTVDPRDKDSTPGYQLETAMGSAIAIFKGASAIRVPRSRFVPVKKTNDLLVLRSDVYTLPDPLQGIVAHPDRARKLPLVDLDPAFYQLVGDFDARFPNGAPSLLACQSLEVNGDYKFGCNVSLKGSVRLNNDSGQQIRIEDGAVIDGDFVK